MTCMRNTFSNMQKYLSKNISRNNYHMLNRVDNKIDLITIYRLKIGEM